MARTMWVKVPPELNQVDMDERGVRGGSMDRYGKLFPTCDEALKKIFEAWGVVGYWEIEPVRGRTSSWQVHSNLRVKFMLKFGDGLWRYAAFGGLNGAPWNYCPIDGYPGNNGLQAHLAHEVALAEDEVKGMEARLITTKARVVRIKQELADEVAKEPAKT